MILLIDNYDSFTHNLFQYVSELGEEVKVVRNDAITLEEIKRLEPEAIILSPGPGRPDEAGICIDAVKTFAPEIPLLGICLGNQAIGAGFGAEIVPSKYLKHGKTSMLTHKSEGIFNYLTQPLEVMRYHSLAIKESSVPASFDVIATSMEDDEVMAIQHNYLPIYGLQFHPESIGTKHGKQIIENFFSLIGKEHCHETVSR